MCVFFCFVLFLFFVFFCLFFVFVFLRGGGGLDGLLFYFCLDVKTLQKKELIQICQTLERLKNIYKMQHLLKVEEWYIITSFTNWS